MTEVFLEFLFYNLSSVCPSFYVTLQMQSCEAGQWVTHVESWEVSGLKWLQV